MRRSLVLRSIGTALLVVTPVLAVVPPAAAAATPQLTAVRAAAHPGYDRLVFQFSGSLPARHTVSWVSEVVQDASGLPVPLGGKAFLKVVFAPATAHTAAGAPTYAGLPGRYDLPVLRQVKAAGDFEGVLSFGIGIWQRAALHVFTLTGPARLVIDISVPSGGPGRLAELDNGRLVYLRAGQQADIALRTCVSCGYSWYVAGAPDPAVIQVTATSVVALPHPEGLVGSPSETRWTVRAMGPGHTNLWLYEKPPARDAGPVARYLVRFVVTR